MPEKDVQVEETQEETPQKDVQVEETQEETPQVEEEKVSASTELASTLASQLFDHEEPRSEEQEQVEEELPPVPRVKVGDAVYDYDFVEAAVTEAERIAGVADEMEAELEQTRQIRQNLEELEYIVKAIHGRLGDPTFYQNLQALLEGRSPQPVQSQPSYDEEQEEPQRQPEMDYVRQFDERLTQALTPIYAVQAKQAAEQYLTDIESRYNLKLTPEQRATVTNRAIDRGDFRSEHLFGQAAENPLEGAFFESLGPQLLAQRQQEKEQPKGLPEKTRHVSRSSSQTRTSALANELLGALRQGS